MTERDDDIIEFDFFDEPETEQATQRRPALRPRQSGRPGGGGPRRPTFRTPQGVTPLLRLILLIALAIFVVIVLVFWVQSCRSESRTNAYRDYMADMKTVGDASAAIGRDLNEQLLTPGVDQQDLIKAIEGLAQRQKQVVEQRRRDRPARPAPRGARRLDRVAPVPLQRAERPGGRVRRAREHAGRHARGRACSPRRRSGSSRAT